MILWLDEDAFDIEGSTTERNIVGVAHFAQAHRNPHVTWHGLCALNLDVAIGWEASGVILDCCRCITGISCTKVLH